MPPNFAARSSLLIGKFGYRWEGRESWLKSGVFLGSVSHRGRWYLNSPEDVVFDTRFNNRLTVEPVITLLPSLRRKHTDPIYFFQHRVTNAFPLGRTFDFKVEYRFRSAS